MFLIQPLAQGPVLHAEETRTAKDIHWVRVRNMCVRFYYIAALVERPRSLVPPLPEGAQPKKILKPKP